MIDAHTRRMAVLAVLLATAGLSACAPVPEPGPTPEPPLTATVHIHAGDADVTGADGDTVAEPDGAEVTAGAIVEAVGADALVELAWSDGAVTRLGPESRFLLGGADGSDTTRGEQIGGLSWNREAAAAEEGEYAVRSAGTVVADRGAYFVIDCRSSTCRVTGVGGGGGDGSKTTLRRGSLTAVGTTRAATWGELFGDPWAQRNAELDAEAGLPPVTDVFEDAEPGRASLSGTFDVVVTTVTSECDGGDLVCDTISQTGRVRNLSYSFGTDCSDGIPCAPTVTTQFTDLATGKTQSREVPLRFDGTRYLWGWVDRLEVCIWDYGDGRTESTGSADNGLSWSAEPTDADVVDGAFVVTAMGGDAAAYVTVLSPVDSGRFPGCERWQADWDTTSTIELARAGR
ncbi:hypothetical protein [uncultured Microbacterium sp.]|uniref:Uncharacterized protein n=1 Tax=uncultured Microbacterium sp. TaxID=191216 RepID=A0A1Y5P5F7_9MICO|nr:hypothetical protein [uncultured Microbacterium sp.]SBS73915.1 exported hypothetical protein [uncultured Microbacterium sp.]